MSGKNRCKYEITAEKKNCIFWLTWVFAPTTPLDKADNKEDQNNEGNGTHQANEPPLGGDVYLIHVSWRNIHTNTHGREESQHSVVL